MTNIIYDNIIFSILKSGGISVVWKELLSRIIKDTNYNCKFLEYTGAKDNIFRQSLNLPDHKVFYKEYPFLKVQRYINPTVNEYNQFIFHSSYYRYCENKNTVNITTVHDFTYEHFAKGLKKFVHCYQKHRAIRHSNKIICISENTKKDLLFFIPDIPEDKIEVIYNGVSDDYYPISNLDINTLPFSINSYAVFVGARAWYKRFDLAVETISKTALNFVIVGNELSTDETSMLERKLKGRYKYLGRISNSHLNRIYNGAYCLLYPSEYEGFGIPIIESQKAGCPVIAFNSSSIPEIIGDRSLLFDSLMAKDILSIIDRLKSPTHRDNIINNGYINANKYNWDKMYNQITDLYKDSIRL